MKINWKVRLRHPAFYTAAAALIGLFVTDMGWVEIGQYEMYVQLLLGVLVAGGFIVDLTTAGISDSKQAMTYDEPKKEDGADEQGNFY